MTIKIPINVILMVSSFSIRCNLLSYSDIVFRRHKIIPPLLCDFCHNRVIAFLLPLSSRKVLPSCHSANVLFPTSVSWCSLPPFKFSFKIHLTFFRYLYHFFRAFSEFFFIIFWCLFSFFHRVLYQMKNITPTISAISIN